MKTLVCSLLCVMGLGLAAPAFADELKAGDQAPDFSLPGSDGKTYKLSDFKGKRAVVLAWGPFAFTQAETLVAKSFVSNGANLRRYDIALMMVNLDPMDGEKGDKAFAKETGADFPILSDATKKAAEAYGVLAPNGRANRWTFYIDKNGKITYIEKMVKPETSAEDMIGKLAELKVPMMHKGTK